MKAVETLLALLVVVGIVGACSLVGVVEAVIH